MLPLRYAFCLICAGGLAASLALAQPRAALEGGVNGIWITDSQAEGSVTIVGGTIEGVSGPASTWRRHSCLRRSPAPISRPTAWQT
jgi:hypothetical protein